MTTTSLCRPTPNLLYHLVVAYGVPDYVKRASQDDLFGRDDLEYRAFALPEQRDLPIHTKAATWLSAARLADGAASGVKLARASAAVDAAARIWGIAADVKTIAIKAASIQDANNQDDDPADFAIVDERGEPRLPVRDRDEAVKAAGWFVRYRDQFEYDDRRCIAEFVLRKAAQFHAYLGDDGVVLSRTAGLGRCAAVDAKRLVADRAILANASGNVKQASAYAEVHGLIGPVWDDEAADMTVRAVDAIDRTWGRGRLSPPEDVIHGVTLKDASDYARTYLTTRSGSTYRTADLDGIRIQDLADYVGSDAASCLTRDGVHLNRDKAAGALSRWDVGLADLFDKYAQDRDIKPVSRRPALAATARFAVSDLVRLVS